MQNIVIGREPDFFLKRGREEIYHTGRIEILKNGTKVACFSFYDRSLYGLLVKFQTVLIHRGKDISFVEIKEEETKSGLDLASSETTFKISLIHPHGVSPDSIRNIRQFILKFFEHFYKY